jgi:hypothetical protein
MYYSCNLRYYLKIRMNSSIDQTLYDKFMLPMAGSELKWSCTGRVLCAMVWPLSGSNADMGEGSYCLERCCHRGSARR